MTNQLQRIFYKHKIKLVFSNKGKLSNGLGNPKDKIDILEKSGIYQIKCQGCDMQFTLDKPGVTPQPVLKNIFATLDITVLNFQRRKPCPRTCQ
jgi:hypothetical protein